MIRRVVLVGLSGTGKSTLSRLIAADLGWTAYDTDSEVERRAGVTIPELFRDRGEADFRALERSVIHDALARSQVVIATGGGAVNENDIWTLDHLGHPDTLVAWLDADSAILVDRLMEQSGAGGATTVRPLLSDGDPLQRLDAMRALRSGLYGRADTTIPVDRGDPAGIAADIAEIARLDHGTPSRIQLETAGARSTITVGPLAIDALAGLIAVEWPKAQHVWTGVDENVRPLVDSALLAVAKAIGPDLQVITIPAGESSKSLAGISRLFDWMLQGGIERGDAAVAVGGGVVGDLVGFAASTVLRGVGLVQIPTTLLAMVDSSVGGKTGINHAMGKNLIGTFYQPRHVLIDPALLASLPERVYRSGWAEIIKHAVIEPSTPGGGEGRLMALLERNSAALAAQRSPLLPLVIRKNVSLKAAVVANDERESGLRAILNLGHTIGHALEATGSGLMHGEAVAVGMCASMVIAREMGWINRTSEDRVRDLIDAFGLPVTATFDRDAVRRTMQSDKKVSAGVQQWVLPLGDAGVAVETGVPDAAVVRALHTIARPPAGK